MLVCILIYIVYVMVMLAVPSVLKLLFPKCCTSIPYRTSLSLSPPRLCRLSLVPVAIGGVDQNLPVQVSALRPGGVAEQWVFLLSFNLSLFLPPFPSFLSGFLSLPLSFHLSLGVSLPLPLSFLFGYFLSLSCLFCLCCHQ